MLLVFVLFGASLCVLSSHAAPSKPNIVLFFVDDLGYGDLGFTGHPSTSTPHLDRLASMGKRLTNWYSGYPVCTASRTALLTGRQAPRVGMPGVLNSLGVEGLPLNETTIADQMKKAGYRTLAIGKWHQGQLPAYLPAERGFDEFYGLPFSVDDGTGYISSCDGYDSEREDSVLRAKHAVTLGPQLPLPLIHQNKKEGISAIIDQPTDLIPLTERFLSYIQNFTVATPKEVPMFLYIAFGHTHTATPNINPPEQQYAGCPFQGSTTRGGFGDALAEVDNAVHEVVTLFDDLELSENTLFVFVSDNGPSLRHGLGAGSMGIFTGSSARYANGTSYVNTGKGSTWEGGIRMPAFAYWPGKIAPYTRSDEVISTMDLFPTFSSLGGAPLPLDTVLDGRDMLDILLLDQAKSKHEYLWFYNAPYYGNVSKEIYAVRHRSGYKAHFFTSPGLQPHGVIPPRVQHDPPLVFDVNRDPSESSPIPLSSLPAGFLSNLMLAKDAQEKSLFPLNIDQRYGFEWALCCGIGCEEPCTCNCKDAPLPAP